MATLHIDANEYRSTPNHQVKKKLQDAFGEDQPTYELLKDATVESRSARLTDAEDSVFGGRDSLEELRDEMQYWLDNMPENLQGSDKASEIEDCISNLEQLIGDIESLDFSTVEVPGMC